MKEALKDNTAEALGHGAFGAPTMVLDGSEMFFGCDRLELLAQSLGAKAPSWQAHTLVPHGSGRAHAGVARGPASAPLSPCPPCAAPRCDAGQGWYGPVPNPHREEIQSILDGRARL